MRCRFFFHVISFSIISNLFFHRNISYAESVASLTRTFFVRLFIPRFFWEKIIPLAPFILVAVGDRVTRLISKTSKHLSKYCCDVRNRIMKFIFIE